MTTPNVNEEVIPSSECPSENQNDVETAQDKVESDDTLPKPLSKKQLKRLKKAETWKSGLQEKRMKERLKLKEKRAEARKNNIELGPTRKKLKNNNMASSSCKIRVVLDFSFDELMSNKDICKCVSQTLRCYSINRRAENPLQFHIVNVNGESLKILSRHNGFTNWDAHISHEPYLNIFSKEALVYLTSESDNVINNFDEDKVYIIGAFVDHNAHKGLCLKTAQEQGIEHGRLPIGEYLNMKSRKVLAINHVFEIILKVCNGSPWKEALFNVLPQRKNAVIKDKTENSGNEESNSASIENEESNIENTENDESNIENTENEKSNIANTKSNESDKLIANTQNDDP